MVDVQGFKILTPIVIPWALPYVKFVSILANLVNSEK